MTCAECEAAARKRLHGTYLMGCLECCARLVLSARPSRPHAGAMLAAIERWLTAQTVPPFTVADVTAKAREILPALEARSASVATDALATMRSSILARSRKPQGHS